MINFNKIFKEFAKISFFCICIFFQYFVNSYAMLDVVRRSTLSCSSSTDDKDRYEAGNEIDFGALAMFPYSSSDESDAAYGMLANPAGHFNIGLDGDCSTDLTAAYTLFKLAPSGYKKDPLILLLAKAAGSYAVAYNYFNNLELCGSDWYVWGSSTNSNCSGNVDVTIGSNYPEFGPFHGSKKYEAFKKISNKSSNSIKSKESREIKYNGEEFESDSCYDPRPEAKKYDVNADEETPKQLYYFRGSDGANYACDRFLNGIKKYGDESDEFYKAYKCCVEKSKSVCVHLKNSTGSKDVVVYCPINGNGNGITGKLFNGKIDSSLCWINSSGFSLPVGLKVFSGEENGEYCIKTASLCPYNFNLQDGSLITSTFDSDACYDTTNNTATSCTGKIDNFYQYRRHCTIVEPWKSVQEDLQTYPAFFDKACINMVGSSHNTDGYESYSGYKMNFSDYKSFTAPIAECVTETLKNFIFNIAGHTECSEKLDGTYELPDENEECSNGYKFYKGEDLSKISIDSPVFSLLKYMHNIFIAVVTLMVTLFGYNLIVNGGKIETKDVLGMLIKVILVLTFSLDSWWYTQVYKFAYGASSTFSSIVDKIAFDDTVASFKTNNDIETIYPKYDGCYFGNIDKINGVGYATPNIGNNNYENYPASRTYVAFFDSLDCKIAKYMGYRDSSDIGSSKILFLIAMVLMWPFSVGLFLVVGSILIVLFVINFALYAVYIFVVSSVGLALMLLLAPLFIPCILFKRFESFFFEKWLKNVLGYILQPVFLFAYVNIALMIMDSYTIGDGAFNSPSVSITEEQKNKPNNPLICGYSCLDANDNIKYITNSAPSSDDCEDIIDMNQNSVLCFLNNFTFSKINTFLGVGLDFFRNIDDFTTSIIISFLRVGLLIFILTKVLYTLPGIIMTVVGGRFPLIPNGADPFSAGRKIFGGLKTFKRAVIGIPESIKNKFNKDSNK